MNPDHLLAQQALTKAKGALYRREQASARWWAQRALAYDPDLEDAWLILSIISSPRASLFYLKHALDINPQSLRARKGLHWAIQRQRAITGFNPASTTQATQPVAVSRPARRPNRIIFFLSAILAFLCLGIVVWLAIPTFEPVLAYNLSSPRSLIALIKPSFTPTPTETFTPTPTATNTPTPTSTFTPTPTATNTPTPTPTNTPPPTLTPQPTQKPAVEAPPSESVNLPPGVGLNDRWVDVNLSQQAAYAYEGRTLVNSFMVSTGTWQHPTVTGTYKIYVKYRYADMTGPGYYLPDVPYVMYFYEGYGLHGTYWHHNFGHPMSHGCVNFRTEDAGWLFSWASVGTVVNVHN